MQENIKTVSELMKKRFLNVREIKSIFEESGEYRLNVVTDDISSKSLFGGVATALIFATLICKKNGWILRLITRERLCNLNDYYNFMKIMQIETPEKVETFSDINYGANAFNRKLNIYKKDIFLATSWWSAKSILGSNFTNRIIYIIQEVETFFYEYGDTRFLCDTIMRSDQIDFLVNTRLLYEYLISNGYTNIEKNGIYFEPSFPQNLYHAKNFIEISKDKNKLFFYARPLNPRNLYYMGIRCLNRAIMEGVVDTDVWDIYFAGKNDSDEFVFDNGYKPIFANQLGWLEYAEFARNIDVSLSLMYTPHPSYPPFDMVASGAIVVTNEFENKQNLNYSKNMITKPLTEEEIVKGIDEAVKLAENLELREQNYNNNNILRDWNESFKEAIDVFTKKIVRDDYVCY